MQSNISSFATLSALLRNPAAMFCFFVGCSSEENALITPGNQHAPPKFLAVLFDLGLNTAPVKTVDYKSEQQCFV